MTTVQRSLVPSLFRTTVIRADNTLLKCLRLLYFHGGCARASLSDFLPSAAHFRYFTLCCMHASPTMGLPHRKRICTLLHGGTVAEVETRRETDAESLNPGAPWPPRCNLHRVRFNFRRNFTRNLVSAIFLV